MKLTTVLKEINTKPQNNSVWVYAICSPKGTFSDLLVLEGKDIVSESDNDDCAPTVTYMNEGRKEEEYFISKIQVQ